VEYFAGDVALEAAHHFVLRLAFDGAPRHVVAGGLVAAQPHDQDDACRARFASRLPPRLSRCRMDGLAAGGFQRADPGEFGQGGLVADALSVVADGGKQGGRGVGAHTVEGT
jgi:hypothetical protein